MRTLVLAAAIAALIAPNLSAGAPVVGQDYRWTVSFRADLEGQAGETPGVSTLSGEWHSTVVAVRPDAYDVRVQLVSVRLAGNRGGAVDPAVLKLAQDRLTTPFWLTCGTNGTIGAVHFLKKVSASDRNLLQTIATETQFASNSETGPVWTRMERDGGGSYLAIYQRRDAAHVRKKKVKYLVPDAGADSMTSAFAMTIEESEVNFAFTPDGALATVDGLQRVRVRLSGANSNSLVTRIEVHLSDLRASQTAAGVAGGVPHDGVDHLPVSSHQPDPKVAQVESDDLLLEGHTNDEILSAAGGKDSMVERRMAAMFRRRPPSIPLGVKRLTEGPGLQAIASALSASGSAQAVQALCGIVRDTSRTAAVRVSVLIAIQGIAEPSVDVMQVPVGLLSDHDPDVRNAARLASGALARSGRAAHASEADAIDAALVMRVTQAATAAEKRDYISALGNSGGPRTVPVLAASLGDQREEIRVAAARSLRLVAGPEAGSILATAATKDTSPAVREAALFAMSFRAPLTTVEWDAVLKAAREDDAAYVRNRAVALLRNDPARPPEAEDTLEWVALHDPSEPIRRVATTALAAIR